MDDTIMTITVEEYESLKEDSMMLICLESCGVDNWDGYSYAIEMYQESKKDA